jgi:hypothetical protein
MDIFGSTDSRKMPAHFFFGALHLDHKTAIRGDPAKQNYSVCPRHWYIDADFKCSDCPREFTWTAKEQKAWFESYFFWVDTIPRQCKNCMAKRRRLTNLRKEYDTKVPEARAQGSPDQKRRIIAIIGELESAFSGLPERMIETKTLFERQLRKSGEPTQ